MPWIITWWLSAMKSLSTLNHLPPVWLSIFSLMLFSCDQAALWMIQSVLLYVHLLHLFHYVPIIVSLWSCLELLLMTEVRSMQKVKVRGLKVKVTEVKIQFSCFRTVTPVWIHIMVMKWCTKLDVAYERCPIVFQGRPSNFKVTWLKSLPILIQIGSLWTVTAVWIHQWLRNDA